MLGDDNGRPEGTDYFQTLLEEHVEEPLLFSEAVARYMRDELAGAYQFGGERFEAADASGFRDDFQQAYQTACQAVVYLAEQGKAEIGYQGNRPVIVPDAQGLAEEPVLEDEPASEEGMFPSWATLQVEDEPDGERIGEGPFDEPLSREGEVWGDSYRENRDDSQAREQEATMDEEGRPTRL